MAELTPIPTAQRASDADYQPLAGFAVAAIVTAGLFLVILVGLLAHSFIQKRPMLSYEPLLLPTAGIVFAILGRRQIRRSEGTRTGLKITAIAWWICVLGGGGFLSYVMASSYVLEREAVRFSEGFLQTLKKGEINSAFLNVLDPPARNAGARPADKDAFEQEYAPKGLVSFRNHELVQLFLRNQKDVTWEHLGGRNLTQEGGNFHMTQVYRLTCPEGVFEVAFGITAKDNRKGLVSQWQLAGARGEMYVKVTPEKISRYGQALVDAQAEATQFARLWAEQMNVGRMAQAHLLTLPAEYRAPWLDQIGLTAHLAGGAAIHQPMTNNILPPARQIKDKTGNELAFDDLYANNFFQFIEQGDVKPFPAEKYDIIRRLWLSPRMAPTEFNRPLPDGSVPPEKGRMLATPDQLVVFVPFDMPTSSTTFVRVMIGVQAESPEFLSQLNEARQAGATLKADPASSISRGPDRMWRVAHARSDMATQSVITGPGSQVPGGGR